MPRFAPALALVCASLPTLGWSDPMPSLGDYTPTALAKAMASPDKAVLIHVVSKFCVPCEAQKIAIAEAGAGVPDIHKHASTVEIPIETWRNSSLLKKLEVEKAGVMVLVRGQEILGRVTSADVGEITALITPLVPVPPAPPVDPLTGLPIDPSAAQPPS